MIAGSGTVTKKQAISFQATILVQMLKESSSVGTNQQGKVNQRQITCQSRSWPTQPISISWRKRIFFSCLKTYQFLQDESNGKWRKITCVNNGDSSLADSRHISSNFSITSICGIKTSLWRTCIHFHEALTTGTQKCITYNSHHHWTFKS